MPENEFDLNIEQILEDWEIFHAVREIIANALDEQLLTGTQDVEIFADENNHWHVRDYGRGLQQSHLTEKENPEKVNHPHTIGKFGIGLKDALATFYRKGVDVSIESKYGRIRLAMHAKHGFGEIETLHAIIDTDHVDPDFVGTDVVMAGVSQEDMELAKGLFLRFSGDVVLETTKYGEILQKARDAGVIYINGVKCNEEENFLFSYNISSLTKPIKKALNRERSNVGRQAYSERVKSILLEAREDRIAKMLVDDLQGFARGDMHDELNWIDVQTHAVKILNAKNTKTVFLTPEELIRNTDMVDEARSGGYEIVTIPEALKQKVRGLQDIDGNQVRDLGGFMVEYQKSFEFKFVDEPELTPAEREIFNLKDQIFGLIGGQPPIIESIVISENMRKQSTDFRDDLGLWELENHRIIIKRTELQSSEKFGDTLLHETAHATSGAPDVSRDFELELSRLLGLVATRALKS